MKGQYRVNISGSQPLFCKQDPSVPPNFLKLRNSYKNAGFWDLSVPREVFFGLKCSARTLPGIKCSISQERLGTTFQDKGLLSGVKSGERIQSQNQGQDQN